MGHLCCLCQCRVTGDTTTTFRNPLCVTIFWFYLLKYILLLIFWCQIYSQCNIYEAGQKKIAFKYLSEKVSTYRISCCKIHALLSCAFFQTCTLISYCIIVFFLWAWRTGLDDPAFSKIEPGSCSYLQLNLVFQGLNLLITCAKLIGRLLTNLPLSHLAFLLNPPWLPDK